MSFNRYQVIFLASPIVWAVYFVIVYLLNEAACKIGLLRDSFVGISIFLMLPALAATVYVTWMSWRSANHPVAEHGGEINAAETERFTGQVGVWLNGLFVVLTLGVGVAAMVLLPC